MTVDMTFCGSPNCTNKCGRQMKPEQNAFLDKYPNKPVYYTYFCGEPECEHEHRQTLAKSGMWFDEICHKCGHRKSALEKLGLTNND